MSVRDDIKDEIREHSDDVVPFLVRAIPAIVRWFRARKGRDITEAMVDLRSRLNDRFDEAEDAIREKHEGT